LYLPDFNNFAIVFTEGQQTTSINLHSTKKIVLFCLKKKLFCFVLKKNCFVLFSKKWFSIHWKELGCEQGRGREKFIFSKKKFHQNFSSEKQTKKMASVLNN
jgi:hypothetical protein